MKVIKLIFPWYVYRGVKVRKYMGKLLSYLFFFFLILFCIPFGFYVYSNLENYQAVKVDTIVTTAIIFLVVLAVSAYLTFYIFKLTKFGAKLENLQKTEFFLEENGYTYQKKSRNKNAKEKIVFPKIYVKQGKYDLEIAFHMAGNKFQEKFKKIGSDLETTLFMDFMEVVDDPNFRTYKMAYSALQNRIKTSEVGYVEGQGLKIMKNLYWDWASDPHMLICGGTGGGKTVLLRTLILGLAKQGVVEIADPKQADFVTMLDIKAFNNRVDFYVEDIVQAIERASKIMFLRYKHMRSERAKRNDKDMGKFSDYGLEPYFFVIDEYNAFISMLDFQQRNRVDTAMGNLLLLGRQSGCFVLIAMQKPSREDLGSKFQANINFRVSVGRLDEMGYELAFGEVNRNKDFKYLKYVNGQRVYGRGYTAINGEVAREFYSPVLEKNFSFFDEYQKLDRKEHTFNREDLSQEELEELRLEMTANIEKGKDKQENKEKEVKSMETTSIDEIIKAKQNEEREEKLTYLSDLKTENVGFSQLKGIVDILEKNYNFVFDRKDKKVVLSKEQVETFEDIIANMLENKNAPSVAIKEVIGM